MLMTDLLNFLKANSALADWFNGLVAVSALLVSFKALSAALSGSKQTTFLALDKELAAPDTQRGRRLLHKHAKSVVELDALLVTNSDVVDQINYALAQYNTLALYLRLRLVRKKPVLIRWGGRIVDGWSDIETFRAFRRIQSDNPHLWDELDVLYAKAVSWKRRHP